MIEEGFIASPTQKDNYCRIWSRDSSIMGLASLLTGKEDLIETCRRSLCTLSKNQGPHGEIPSNVDPRTKRVSYGGTAGRVDGNLWFIICCGEYWKKTGDDRFIEQMIDSLEQARWLLEAWEYNNRGLLYVPPTGDWADEYVQSGYVLYDELLYLQALREIICIHRHLHGSANHELEKKASRLKHLIRANYWFWEEDDEPEDLYHEILYDKGRKAAAQRGGYYWMPYFSPTGYGYRFDTLANVFVTLFEVSDEEHEKLVDEYIADRIVHEEVMLLPAFDPVIRPQDKKWHDLQMNFSYTFKNAPYEYHNGGLWPMVTGFYAASLAKRGQSDLARKYLTGIHNANKQEMDGDPWSFPEYLHGKKYVAEGTSRMGWSAAAAILAEHYLEGKGLFE
ncbi:MAG: glycogen debranching protein [Candidatus Omnitrophica bacterium]|nr:glycogen debranching protein [Candidatus Omnitrophota bacterium]